MKDIDEIRRENLRRLESEYGSTTAAANAAGMSLSQFANLRDGARDSRTGKRRGMRKETARRIEENACKPAGWLDIDHAEKSTLPAEQQLLESLRLLCEREGGHEAVAAAIKCDSQILWQTLNAAQLASGDAPRVEPNLKNRLDARYPDWSLLWRRTALKPVNMENNPDYPSIRSVRFKLSAGIDGFGLEYLDDDDRMPIVFQSKWYKSRGLTPAKLFAIDVTGQSMEPGLYEGDTVVVNTASTQPKDGVVFAVNYEGQLAIKRLMRDAGQWWLASDNPNKALYPRKLCDENCFLIGEVVHKQSERV